MKKILFVLIGSVVIASCDPSQKSSGPGSGKTDTNKTKTESDGSDRNYIYSWDYRTDTDKMTSKAEFSASISATNKLYFNSPYDGGSVGSLTLRNQNNANDVILDIDKGQFVCGSAEGCEINVRFDGGTPVTFKGSTPSDGSSKTLFLAPEKKLINKIKKAKKMLIEAEFYESGTKIMEFSVNGLKWAR